MPGAPGSYIVQTWTNTEPDRDRAELAVFCLGTNDAVLRVAQADTIASAVAALDRADELDVPVFWIGPPPIGDVIEEDRALKELSEALGELMAARDVPFISTFDELGAGSVWRAEASAGDGSHPGAGGYAELAELVERGGLVDWITESAKTRKI